MPVTRVGDMTQGMCCIGFYCCPHPRGGINDMGAPTVTVNSLPLHRAGDKGTCICPHAGTFITNMGSKSVTAMGLPVSRVGDTENCIICGFVGVHQTGSFNVTCGE